MRSYLVAMVALAALTGLCASSTPTPTSANNSPCHYYNLAHSYDVAIVGSGLGGSVMARRLAERNPDWNILVIERGPAYNLCPACASTNTDAAATIALQSDPLTGGFITSTPQPGLNGQTVTVKDTAIQSGSTAINGMQHVRANAHYYWDTYWPVSWNWDVMTYFFEEYENYHYPDGYYGPGRNPFPYRYNFRGNSGPVDVTQSTVQSPQYFTATSAVFPHIAAYTYRNGSVNNGYNPGLGSSPQEFTYYNGRRSSAYVSYVQPYTDSNLREIVNTRVNKIIFTGKKATGLEIVFWNVTSGLANSTTCSIAATNIVVSAGAFGTPKLLKLSGVGPAAELRALGIPVVSDLPDVGANLDDHVTMFSLNTPNPAGDSNIVLWNPQDDPNVIPTFQLTIAHEANVAGGPLVVAHYLNSRGSVKLASANPNDAPIVDFNYFGNAADKANFAISFNKSLEIVKRLGMTAIPGTDPCAGNPACATPLGQLNAYINAGFAGTGYHWTGTSSICKVVNSVDLSVKGTNNLYIVDASVLPRTPGGNTMATTYAFSERAADAVEISMKLPVQLGDIITECI